MVSLFPCTRTREVVYVDGVFTRSWENGVGVNEALWRAVSPVRRCLFLIEKKIPILSGCVATVWISNMNAKRSLHFRREWQL